VPGFEAKVGLQANLNLGTIHVPAHAGAGIGIGTEDDKRTLPADIEPFAADSYLIPPKRYVLDLRYSAGLGVKLRDVLDGSIEGKLKISVLFFSKTWRKRLLQFEGLCKGAPEADIPECDFPLISLEGSTDAASGSFPWAAIRMPTPFPKLDLLQANAAPSGTGTVNKSVVGEFFFDSLCTCIEEEDQSPATPPQPECFRDDDCCNEVPNCFNNPATGRNECILCQDRGEPCRELDDCCGGDEMRICNSGTHTCEGLGVCHSACGSDNDCSVGLRCDTDGTCFDEVVCAVK
jgi:hypothetical protein